MSNLNIELAVSSLTSVQMQQLISQIYQLKQSGDSYTICLRNRCQTQFEDQEDRTTLQQNQSAVLKKLQQQNSGGTAAKLINPKPKSVNKTKQIRSDQFQEQILEAQLDEIRMLYFERDNYEIIILKCTTFYQRYFKQLYYHQKAQLILFLGFSQLKLGREQAAKSTFQLAFQIQNPPADVISIIHSNYAACCSKFKKHQSAIYHYRKAIKYNSLCDHKSQFRLQLGPVYHILGTIYLQCKMFQEAARCLNNAIQCKVLQQSIHINQSKLLRANALMKCGQYVTALKDLKQIIEDKKELRLKQTALRLSAQCCKGLGHVQNAIFYYYQLLENTDNYQKRHKYLALIKELQKRIEAENINAIIQPN